MALLSQCLVTNCGENILHGGVFFRSKTKFFFACTGRETFRSYKYSWKWVMWKLSNIAERAMVDIERQFISKRLIDKTVLSGWLGGRIRESCMNELSFLGAFEKSSYSHDSTGTLIYFSVWRNLKSDQKYLWIFLSMSGISRRSVCYRRKLFSTVTSSKFKVFSE